VNALPRILVASLGGTIAMGSDTPAGVEHSLDAAELVRAVPRIEDVASIETAALRRIPGSHLTVADIAEVAQRIAERFSAGVAGVVVTQGTDTIEETAFLLELLGAAHPGPVVVTGAMRNPTVAGADGPANLLAAITVAASREASGCGVLVVMNDEIHAARYVAKRHTSSTAAFASNPLVGWLSEGRPVFVARPTPLPQSIARPRSAAFLASLASPDDCAVALVRVWLGDDGRWVPAIRTLGYAGLVVEGSGGGHVNAPVAPLLEELARHIPVVIASRTGGGSTLTATYAFVGGESDLRRRGLLSAGWLAGCKARLLLHLLVREGASRAELCEAFSAFLPTGTSACA